MLKPEAQEAEAEHPEANEPDESGPDQPSAPAAHDPNHPTPEAQSASRKMPKPMKEALDVDQKFGLVTAEGIRELFKVNATGEEGTQAELPEEVSADVPPKKRRKNQAWNLECELHQCTMYYVTGILYLSGHQRWQVLGGYGCRIGTLNPLWPCDAARRRTAEEDSWPRKLYMPMQIHVDVLYLILHVFTHLRSFTMPAPAKGTSSIAMNVVTQGFYVAATSTMPWVLDVAKFHGVAVSVLLQP